MTTPELLDVRQQLISNLLALGLDPVGLERKYRIPFNRDMFALPNKKGFEVVMFFLFGRLNQVMCQEQFKSCWPITDKKDEQNFRKVCRDWLQTIVTEDANANLPLPRIVASLFMSPGGDKIYQLLFYFSTYVLEHCLRHENGVRSHEFLQRPTLNKQNKVMAYAVVRSLRAGCTCIRKQFVGHSRQAVAMQHEWKVYGSEEVKTYRILSRDIRDREHEVKEQINLAAEKCAARGSPLSGRHKPGVAQYDFDVQSVHRAHRVRKVRELWSRVETHFKDSKADRGVLEDILEGTQDAYCIDTKNLNIRIPDLLLRECEQEIQRRNVDNVYQGGKLNLISLIHLWNLSLHLYIEKLHQISLPNLDEVMPKITTQCHTQQAHLTNAQQLRSKLKYQSIPKLKKDIRTLRERLDAQVFRSTSPDSIRMTSLGFGFMPPTPPVNFSADGIDPSLVPGHDAIRMPPDAVSTPEAAAVLMDNIDQRVRAQQASTVTQGTPVFATRLGTQGRPMGSNTIPISNLPVRGRLNSERVGNKQRTRHHVVTPGGPARSAETGYAAESGTTLHQTSMEMAEEAREAIKAQVSKPQKHNKFKAPMTKTTKPVRRKSQLTPKVERHTTGRKSPKALDILADQIADVVMLGHDAVDYRHVMGGADMDLDASAFVSKDKLHRTPPSESPRSQDSVGPLSSTRVEHGARNEARNLEQKPRDPLVIKLFTNEASDETDGTIVTIATEPEPRPSPSTHRRHHPAGCEADGNAPGRRVTPVPSPQTSPIADRVRDMSQRFLQPSTGGEDLPAGRSLALTSGAVVISGNLLGMTEHDHMAAAQRPAPRTQWGSVSDSGSESNTEQLSGAERVAALPESTDTDSLSSYGRTHPYTVTSEHIHHGNLNNSSARNVIGAEVERHLPTWRNEMHQASPPRTKFALSDHEDDAELISDEVLPGFSNLLNESLVLSAKKWDRVDDDANANAQLDGDEFAELVNASARVIELQNGSFTERAETTSRRDRTDLIVDDDSPVLAGSFSRNSGARGSFRDVEQNVLQSFISSSLQQTLTHGLSGRRTSGEWLGQRASIGSRSRSPRQRVSADKKSTTASHLNAADIITKYRKLKERQAAGGLSTSNTSNNASPGSSTGGNSLQSSPSGSRPHTPTQQFHTPVMVGSPVLSERYLQQTPTKEDAPMSRRFTLNLDDLEDDADAAFTPPRPGPMDHRSWHLGNLTMSPLATPETPQILRQQSHINTPTTHHVKSPATRNKRVLEQRSVAPMPLSPVTNDLHTFDLQPSTGLLSLDNFLNDSAPALLPLSPFPDEPLILTHSSPSGTRLLDL